MIDRRLQRRAQRRPAPRHASVTAVILRIRMSSLSDRLEQRALDVTLPAAIVRRAARSRRVVETVQAREETELRLIEPRIEDRVREPRVEVVHDRDGRSLVVTAVAVDIAAV